MGAWDGEAEGDGDGALNRGEDGVEEVGRGGGAREEVAAERARCLEAAASPEFPSVAPHLRLPSLVPSVVALSSWCARRPMPLRLESYRVWALGDSGKSSDSRPW